jgi:hypothetical protein
MKQLKTKAKRKKEEAIKGKSSCFQRVLYLPRKIRGHLQKKKKEKLEVFGRVFLWTKKKVIG